MDPFFEPHERAGSATMRSEQYRGIGGLLQSAGQRFAGMRLVDAPQRVQEALMLGQLNLEDDTGKISIGVEGPGSFALIPKGKVWNVRGSVGSDPRVMVGFDTAQLRPPVAESEPPAEPPSAGRLYADALAERVRSQDPGWYRYGRP